MKARQVIEPNSSSIKNFLTEHSSSSARLAYSTNHKGQGCSVRDRSGVIPVILSYKYVPASSATVKGLRCENQGKRTQKFIGVALQVTFVTRQILPSVKKRKSFPFFSSKAGAQKLQKLPLLSIYFLPSIPRLTRPPIHPEPGILTSEKEASWSVVFSGCQRENWQPEYSRVSSFPTNAVEPAFRVVIGYPVELLLLEIFVLQTQMGSQAGILHRPIAAIVAVAAASVSIDIPDKFASFGLFGPRSASVSPVPAPVPEPRGASWVDYISVSKVTDLSFVARILVPVPNVSFPTPSSSTNLVPSLSPVLSSYQFPELIKALKPDAITKSVPTPVPDCLYRWHLPDPNVIDVFGSSDCSLEKSRTVVVLLGWLGSKQKHLKAYADWYTSRGFHAITFTLPMTDMLSYQAGGKTEQNIDMLVHHLAEWLEEEHGKNLVFHTFSNTGWLTYGAILEKFQKEDPPVVKKIRGCIVDSAPVAAPDPQVWASGFCAAFLKKNSIATKGLAAATEPSERIVGGTKEVKPSAMEAALLLVLEKFFQVILNLPTVNRRLSDVIGLLSSGQPGCPQLYIYSSADRVIPAGCVESFIEKQREVGHEVRACNFVSTPHVDHFRNDPKLYSGQLSRFLDDCVLTCCRRS